MLDFLTEFTPLQYAGMAVAIYAAAVLRAFTGFGFALAALPILTMFILPGSAASMVAMLTLGVSLQGYKNFANDVELKPMMTMVGISAIGTLIGAFLLASLTPNTFKLSIGITVMIACVLLTQYKPAHTTSGGIKAWLAASLSGLMNGALAIPGPPVIVYAMAVFKDARESRAFLLMFFLFSAIFAIIGFTIAGLLGLREIVFTLVAYPIMLAGDKTGFWLFENYGKAAYRNIAIGALFLIGVSITIAALTS